MEEKILNEILTMKKEIKAELLKTNEKVDRLEKNQQKFSEELSNVKEDIAELKEDVAVLKEDVAVLKEDVAVLKEDVAVLKEDVAVLKEDVAVLKEDVAVLKEDVAELKEDVAVLKEDVAELKEDVVGLKKNDIKLSEEIRQVKLNQALMLNVQTRMLKEQREFRKEVNDKFYFYESVLKTQIIDTKVLQIKVDLLNKKIDGGLYPAY